jgi:hypothetical protein
MSALRALRTSAIELPVAAFAALSVAFVAFAAPGDILGELIGLTGLPSVLPAAQPPLGATARIALGVIGSGLAFALAYGALRWLDRFAAPRARPEPVLAPEEAPRLRRRDLHPDAPAVRPILADRDLGTPAPPAVPAWLAPDAEAPAPVQGPPPALADLMARLEEGVARREQPTPRAAPPAAEPEPFVPPSPDRLQNAIESLQRLAARHG